MSISQFPLPSGSSLKDTYKLEPGVNPLAIAQGIFNIDSAVTNTYPYTFTVPGATFATEVNDGDTELLIDGSVTDITMAKEFSAAARTAINENGPIVIRGRASVANTTGQNRVLLGSETNLTNGDVRVTSDDGTTYSNTSLNGTWNGNVLGVLYHHPADDRPHQTNADAFLAFGNRNSDVIGYYTNDFSGSSGAPGFNLLYSSSNNRNVRDMALYMSDSTNTRIAMAASDGHLTANNNSDSVSNANQLSSGVPSDTNATDFDGTYLYVTSGLKMYRNTDFGNNGFRSYVESTTSDLPKPIQDRGLAASPNEILALSADLDVYKSTDKGETFTTTASIGNTNGSMKEFRYFGNDITGVFAISTNNGHLHLSIDKGETFTTSRPGNARFYLGGQRLVADSGSRTSLAFATTSTETYKVVPEIPHLSSYITLTQVSKLVDLT